MVDQLSLTLLYHACKLFCFSDKISMLVNDFKADINFRIRGYDNNSILSFAIVSNNVNLTRFLFSFKDLDLNIEGNNRNKVLHLCAAIGNEEILSLVYEKVDSKIPVNGSGQTPLSIAASMGKSFSFPSVRRVGGFFGGVADNQPIIFSAKESYLKCIKLLLGIKFNFIMPLSSNPKNKIF